MTGLTKDGQAVASSSYNLYGARKTSTDTTGNPFAYNGEAHLSCLREDYQELANLLYQITEADRRFKDLYVNKQV